MTGRSASLFRHGLLGLTIGTASLCALIGTGPALLAAGIHATMYVFVLSSSINGLCHHVGLQELRQHRDQPAVPRAADRRRGPSQQPSRVPAQPEFSFRASEIDPAWPVIRLLIALKLATPSKTIEELAA